MSVSFRSISNFICMLLKRLSVSRWHVIKYIEYISCALLTYNIKRNSLTDEIVNNHGIVMINDKCLEYIFIWHAAYIFIRSYSMIARISISIKCIHFGLRFLEISLNQTEKNKLVYYFF